LFIKLFCLWLRFNVQLLCQQTGTGLILAMGFSPLSVTAVQGNKPSLGWFMEWVQGYPALGILNGLGEITSSFISAGQFFQRPAQITAQLFRLQQLPFVKSRAAGQGKPS